MRCWPRCAYRLYLEFNKELGQGQGLVSQHQAVAARGGLPRGAGSPGAGRREVQELGGRPGGAGLVFCPEPFPEAKADYWPRASGTRRQKGLKWKATLRGGPAVSLGESQQGQLGLVDGKDTEDTQGEGEPGGEQSMGEETDKEGLELSLSSAEELATTRSLGRSPGG